ILSIVSSPLLHQSAFVFPIPTNRLCAQWIQFNNQTARFALQSVPWWLQPSPARYFFGTGFGVHSSSITSSLFKYLKMQPKSKQRKFFVRGFKGSVIAIIFALL